MPYILYLDNDSKETLSRVKDNDPTLQELNISGFSRNSGKFCSDDGRDYATLGEYIGRNTYIKSLNVNYDAIIALDNHQDITSFVGGINRNSSICKLNLHFVDDENGVMSKILKVYQDKNNLDELALRFNRSFDMIGGGPAIISNFKNCTNLRSIQIKHGNRDDGRHSVQNGLFYIMRAIISTLTNCTNLRSISICYASDFTEQAFEALRDHHMLEQLVLTTHIGNAGCDLLATMLEDQNSHLYRLILSDSRRDNGIGINNEGINSLASALARNNRLRELYIRGIELDEELNYSFSNLLCNTSSTSSTYSSNRTLKRLAVSGEMAYTISQLASALYLNSHRNKRHVAMKKILYYHPNIDMEPLFTMDLDGERNLKALPYALAWFDRAAVAVEDEEWIWEDYDVRSNYKRGERVETFLGVAKETYRVKERKLSAAYQFVQAMPLLFVPASHMKASDDR